MNIVKVRNLSYSQKDKVIFCNINLTIVRGKVTAIMGPSGSGKATLSRLLSRQIKPAHGQIEIDGAAITSLSRRKLNQVRCKMGVLFQQSALFTDLAVFENVAFPFRMDILNGIIKSVVFAIVITCIAMYQGYYAQPNTAGISRATTKTVVYSS